MDRNLESYIKIYRNAVSDDLCDQTLALLKDESLWIKHGFHDEYNNKDITYKDDLDVSAYTISNHGTMMGLLYKTIQNYMEDTDLPFYNTWNGYSMIRYNRYNPGTNMKPHCDHINSMFDGSIRGIPTLSIVGLLNEDFEGGDFMMFFENEDRIDLRKGDIMIFPSIFLYPHRVDSVRSGVRYSFVSWVY